jgi:hypothetical protein
VHNPVAKSHTPLFEQVAYSFVAAVVIAMVQLGVVGDDVIKPPVHDI